MDCTGNITGGNKKDDEFVPDIFFDPMNDLDQEKKILDLHMFNIASVCRRVQKILKVIYPMLSCIVAADNTCDNVIKVWASIDEINKLCIEYKAC